MAAATIVALALYVFARLIVPSQPYLTAIATAVPPHALGQEEVTRRARLLYAELGASDIERIMPVFANSDYRAPVFLRTDRLVRDNRAAGQSATPFIWNTRSRCLNGRRAIVSIAPA